MLIIKTGVCALHTGMCTTMRCEPDLYSLWRGTDEPMIRELKVIEVNAGFNALADRLRLSNRSDFLKQTI